MRKPKPVVRQGLLLLRGQSESCDTPIPVGSPLWHAWLAEHSSFIYEGEAGHLTARRETRRGGQYWYAYRRCGGQLAKTYLGRPESLTLACLEQASARLAGQADGGGRSRRPDPPAALGDGLCHQANLLAAPMPSFLPLAKVRPPALPERLVARPRLTQRISAPVTIVCAPSGFGKSTLLNQWCQCCGMPVAWVALDASDNDPASFWYAVITALQAISPHLGEALLPQLHAPSGAVLSETVIGLANEIIRLGEKRPACRRIGLVLDDYHHIRHPQIHASLQALVEHLPPGMQLVISSRSEVPLALAYLRAAGKLSELTADDLRFTLEEGVSLLSASQAPLAYDDAQALVRRTGGWGAGLTLARLALAQQGDAPCAVASFTGAHSYLRDYFVESVLSRQPPPVQSFLLKTAILRNLTGELCDAVTGQAGGAEMLAQLCRENPFLVQSEVRGWYRYHELFAEALYSQLQIQLPEEVPTLHRRAAAWYQAQNAPADTVHHLLAAGACAEAAALIERMALQELEQSGEDSRLLGWLLQLPESVVRKSKTLLSAYVRLASIAMPRTAVERFLTSVEASISREPAPDEQDVLMEIRQIRQQWATGDAVPAAESGYGDVWQMLNGIACYERWHRSDVSKADALAREVYAAALQRGNVFVMLMAGGGYAVTALARGQLRRSERIACEVLQKVMARCGKLPGPASIALSALGQVHYERNELEQAHQLLLRATKVDPSPTSTNMPIRIAMLRALVQAAQGDYAGAQATLTAARELQARRPSGLWHERDLLAYQALCFLREGDVAAAERLLGTVEGGEGHPFLTVARAEVLLSRQRAADAESLLTGLLERYPHGFYQQPTLGARVLLALALFEQHKTNQARRLIAEALRMAAPESHLRPFLDYGPRILPLLALVADTERLRASGQSFAREVVSILRRGAGGQPAPTREELATLAVAASITAREQDVLDRLSRGLSNKEIAEELAISESTVKTHLKNIFRKLEVDSRVGALARVQSLRAVPSRPVGAPKSAG